VLEAAGLVIKPVDKQTLVRVRSMKKGRPPPPPPLRRNDTTNTTASESLRRERELPAIPAEDHNQNGMSEPPLSPNHVDDAFERYETFKQRDWKRMSTLSTSSTLESMAPSATSQPPSSPRSAYSRLHDFLSRRTTPTPEEPRISKISTSSISAPLAMTSPASISREQSPAFGTVSGSWFLPEIILSVVVVLVQFGQ
jgi:actin cytoskeleton-regulatory complex protein PAN1